MAGPDPPQRKHGRLAPLEQNDMPRRTVKRISRNSENQNLLDAIKQQDWQAGSLAPVSEIVKAALPAAVSHRLRPARRFMVNSIFCDCRWRQSSRLDAAGEGGAACIGDFIRE
jgi:hypothetical protein